MSALARSGFLETGTDEVLRPITKLMRLIFEVPIAFVSTVGASHQRYKCSIGLGIDELPRQSSLCDAVIERADVIVIEDARSDPRFADHSLVTGPMGIRAYIGAPLLTSDGYAIGTLCIVDREPRRFGEREVAMIRQLAEVVVEQTELLQIAERDALTGTWTRRAFLQAASKAMIRARLEGEPAAMVLFDLDHFKRINDGLGHRIGDLVLKCVVGACEARLREYGTLGRLGGEEFAVLLPGADLAAASSAAERMRKGIEAARLPEAPDLRFTASFGVSPLLSGFERPEDWLEMADTALYRAKANGRNRSETI